MAKRLTLFSLRLLLLVIVADVIAAILVAIPNPTINIIIDILLTLCLWVFVWMDAVNYGQKDFKKDKMIQHRVAETGYAPTGEEGKLFKPWFGFVAGLLSQIPAFLLIIAIIFGSKEINGWLEPFRNIWNLICVHIFTPLAATQSLLYLVPSIMISIVAGLGYLNGPSQQKRLETIIERNKMKRAKRVQDDAKNKKKKSQKR